MNSNDLVQAMDPAGASAVDEPALIAALRRGEEWAFEAMNRPDPVGHSTVKCSP